MMLPIYASRLMDIRSWYAFNCPPGVPALWDGGLKRELWDADWNPISGVSDAFKNTLPNLPLQGYFSRDHFTVTSFPSVPWLCEHFGVIDPENLTELSADASGHGAHAMHVLWARELFDAAETYSFVRTTILPHHNEEAHMVLRGLGADPHAHHPGGLWTDGRVNGYVRAFGFSRREAYVDQGHVWIGDRDMGIPPGYEIEDGPAYAFFDGRQCVGVE